MLLTAGHPVHTLFGHCVVCGATGGKSTSRTGSGIIGPDAAAEAIAAWNRRVVTPEQVEAAANRAFAMKMCRERLTAREAVLEILRAAGFEVQS